MSKLTRPQIEDSRAARSESIYEAIHALGISKGTPSAVSLLSGVVVKQQDALVGGGGGGYVCFMQSISPQHSAYCFSSLFEYNGKLAKIKMRAHI